MYIVYYFAGYYPLIPSFYPLNQPDAAISRLHCHEAPSRSVFFLFLSPRQLKQQFLFINLILHSGSLYNLPSDRSSSSLLHSLPAHAIVRRGSF